MDSVWFCSLPSASLPPRIRPYGSSVCVFVPPGPDGSRHGFGRPAIAPKPPAWLVLELNSSCDDGERISAERVARRRRYSVTLQFRLARHDVPRSEEHTSELQS